MTYILNHNLTFEQKAARTKELEIEYKQLKATDMNASIAKEKEYIALRSEVLAEFDSAQREKRSENLQVVFDRVDAMPVDPKFQTGIRSLDMELVDEDEKMRHARGGFTMGNFISIAGERSAGKSTIMMKIMAGFTQTQKISWFDFEMGEKSVRRKFEKFTDAIISNVEYYGGDRDFNIIIEEIKILYAMGIRHFVIDSMMKIRVKGMASKYLEVSYVSSVLSEMTSRLGINIYMINQMNSNDQRTGTLMMKHGNDVEYDSDYIFFILKKKLDETDEIGLSVYDQNSRMIVCLKTRPDEDRLFNVEIPKSEILGISPEIIEYEM